MLRCSYEIDTAYVMDLCKRLEEFRPYFIEDPLRSESPHAYRNLSKHTSLPIAAENNGRVNGNLGRLLKKI